MQVTSAESEPRHLLALDFHGAHEGVPYLQRSETATSSVTTLAQLHRVAVRSYAHRGPRRRYAAFLEDLFGLPEGTVDDLKRSHASASTRATRRVIQTSPAHMA